MSWPCPDCGDPFTFEHMCPKLKARLLEELSLHTWAWLARTLMLELHTVQQAFQVEQSLRTPRTNRIEPDE